MSTIFLTTCVTSQLNIFRQNTNASQIVSYVQSEDWKVQQRLAEIDKYNLLYDHILICFPVVMHLTSLLCIIYIIFSFNKHRNGYIGDLCVSDIMPFWRSRPSGIDIGLCTLRPASLCLHAVGEFWSWPLTSSLAYSVSLDPVIVFVQLLRSISLICQSHSLYVWEWWLEIHIKSLLTHLMKSI